jgi:protein-disulfide isomerase
LRTAAVALALTAAFITTPAASAPVRKAAPADWSRTVVATPAGGFRMGNPRAQVRLIEYGSLACPHCRHFEETGYKPLLGYVRTGRVSYEFRNFLLNGPDISISLLAHCAGPAKFFPMSEVVFATQPEWEQKLAEMSDADKAALKSMTDQQRIVSFARIANFGPIAQRFGLSSARAQQCLSDQKGLERLLGMTKSALDNGVHATPTFFINGKVADAGTWEELEPQLKAALGARR